VRHRPHVERGQARLRLAILSLILGHTALLAANGAEGAPWMWTASVGSVLFSLGLLARVTAAPAGSAARRMLGAVHDNVAATFWLYHAGPAGALALFVYPFVTVGNGFRFGVPYLAWSGLLGAAGLAFLIGSDTHWSTHATIGAGLLLSHVTVTVYTGVLLRRLHETQDELERLAARDPLTGLPNRRCFMETLGGMLEACRGRQMACLYLDLDGFKAVNDRWGHQAGDDLLSAVATVVRRCVRGGDVLARLGGDEFTIVLVAVSREHAESVAGRIIAAIERIQHAGEHPVEVSASIGISFVPERPAGPVDVDELLKGADEAMYAAKRSGRGSYRLVDFGAARAASAA
jgi:diguanylate cyclase (GGDEF)-like protein